MDHIEFNDIIGNKFKLYMDSSAVPDDDSTAYVISKEGLLCRVTNDLGTFWRPVKEIPALPSANVTPARLHFKKIPKKQLDMILTFFKDVYTKFGTESMARIYETSDGNRFTDAPPQTVTSASVDHKDNRKEKIVLDIHSHGSMDAFFSNTDDNDENAFRFFGVAGDVDSTLKLLFRLKFGEVELEVKVSDVFEGAENGYRFEHVSYPSSWLKKVRKREYLREVTSYPCWGDLDRYQHVGEQDPLYDFEHMEFYNKGKVRSHYIPIGKKRMDKLINAFLSTHFDVQSQVYDLLQEIFSDPDSLKQVRYIFKKLSVDEVKQFLDEVEEHPEEGYESKTPSIKELESRLHTGKLHSNTSDWMALWKARPDLQDEMLEISNKSSCNTMEFSEAPEGLNHLDEKDSKNED